jgi:hypothetical protein
MAGTLTKKGITTITWGTSDMLGSPVGAIVESLQISPKGGSPIEIEDNDGFAATLILVPDGFDATATCLFDTAKTWPAIGAAVTLTLPTGWVDGGTSFSCLLVDKQPQAGRKKEATIQLKLAYRPNVTVP